jgi:hypothetical protein
MKRALLYLFCGISLLIVIATFIRPELSLFLASDSCMDAGGSFDFKQARCDFQKTHPYVTFNLWKFCAAFIGTCAAIILVSRGLLSLRTRKQVNPMPLREQS